MGEDDLSFIAEAVRVEVSDAEARRWLDELKARTDRSPADQALIDSLEAAWREAAAADMRKR